MMSNFITKISLFLLRLVLLLKVDNSYITKDLLFKKAKMTQGASFRANSRE